MEINKTFPQIKVQNLYITRWTVTKEQELTKINLGFEKNLQQVKKILIWNLLSIIN